MKAAAAAAVLLVGGSAYATESGRLPAGTQQRVHNALPFLAPPARPRATQGASATAHGNPSLAASPAPSPSTPFPSTSVSNARLVSLCQAWRAAKSGGSHSTPMPDADLAELIAAAGSDHLEPFCAHVLAGNPEKTNKTPRIVEKTHSHPNKKN